MKDEGTHVRCHRRIQRAPYDAEHFRRSRKRVGKYADRFAYNTAERYTVAKNAKPERYNGWA